MADDVRKTLLARLEAFDPDLLDEATRSALAGYIPHAPEAELDAAAEILSAAFDEPDPTTGATMLFLAERRFRPHFAALGSICAVLLDLLVGEQVDDGRMERLVSELALADRGARQKLLDGLPVANRSLRRAHRTLQKAFAEAPREAQHADVVHRGEPTPYLKQRALVELGIFFAARAAEATSGADKKRLEEAIAIGRAALDDKKARGKVIRRHHDATDLEIVCGVLVDDAHDFVENPSAEGSIYASADAAAAAVRLMRVGPDAVPRVRRLLRDLDEELRRLDVVTAIAAKKGAVKSPIASAVFRADNLWVARLENGDYGLLQKQARKLTWLEGARDDVLSSVPDELFERAALAAKNEA